MRSWPGRHGRVHRASPRQRGFIALIALLIVVVIVCFAIGAMLRQSESSRPDRSAASSASDAPGAVGRSPDGATPIERARAVEDTLRRQAADNERKIEQQLDSPSR